MAKNNKKKYPTPIQKRKIDIVLNTLHKTGGKHKALACRNANISRTTLDKWIKEFELETQISDMCEESLDLAETKLIQAVSNGEKWAITYMLDTKGKERGYTTKQELEVDENVSYVVKYED